jgi:hypothetical protein
VTISRLPSGGVIDVDVDQGKLEPLLDELDERRSC